MIGFYRRLIDRFFGRGEFSVALPCLDGVLLANNALENAEELVEVAAPDHLVARDGALWFSSGDRVMRLNSTGLAVVLEPGAAITAFALSPDGEIAVALEDGRLTLPFKAGELPDASARTCVTSIAFAPGGGCYLSVGSIRNPATAWPRDLLQRNAAGGLWHLTPGAAPRKIAGGLAWPSGALAMEDGSVLVSETSRHRIVSVSPDGRVKERIGDLPGYPAGISRCGHGYAVCLKAPRNQLIEFILREPEFCRDMIRTVPPDYWMAPSLHPQTSFLEPLQGGALKQLGIMKPWAPSRSGGLVIEMDAAFVPRRSHHSRADGCNHGTTSCAQLGDVLAVASQGGGRILGLPMAEGETP